MNLLEYQAKSLLRESGVPVPASWTIRKGGDLANNVAYPVVVKSQVPVGGRGKAGGIRSVDSVDELEKTVDDLFALSIKEHLPRVLLIEEKLATKRELYIALRLNRDNRALEWLASAQGGIDIESNASTVTSLPVTADVADKLASILDIDVSVLTPIVQSIEKMCLTYDALLVEINPLIEKIDGSLVAADAKVMVDDNARFRHPELPWPTEPQSLLRPLGGTIGCIANGAGMAMSTMDTIVAAGGKPANFFDIGGGTGEKEFVKALDAIRALPGVTSIIVNIFAGISRCDEIARGIIAARQQLENLPPLYVRLEGTNRDIAKELLDAAHIEIEPDLRTCVQKALRLAPENPQETKS